MNVQDAANLTIPEGNVRNIHDKNNQLLWSAVGYDVKYRGNTTQQTYSGKNLFNNYDTNYIATNASTSTLTFTTLSTGLKMDFPHSGTPWAVFKVGDMRNYKGKTIRLSMNFTSGAKDYRLMQLSADGTDRGQLAISTTSGETISFAIPADFDDTDTMPYFGVRFTATAQSSVEFTNLILTVDNEDMAYEPYVGGVPAPNPDYPQTVNVVTGEQTVAITGKNLIPTPTYDASVARILSYRVDLPINTYTISFDLDSFTFGTNVSFNVNMALRYSDGTSFDPVILSVNSLSTTGRKSFTFTTTKVVSSNLSLSPSNIRIAQTPYDNGARVVLSNIQLEASSTDTAFEQYVTESYTVNIGSIELCKIGTYQDYIYKSGDGWYVHKEIEKHTFTGQENWGSEPYGTNSWRLNNLISIYEFDASEVETMCDFAKGVSLNTRGQGDSRLTCVCYTNSSSIFVVRNTSLTTQAGIQGVTTGKNLYYKATPTDTQITDATLIGQLNAVHDWLRRYDYYGAVSGNLPIIIDRTGIIVI